jgi:hypothetical protein
VTLDIEATYASDEAGESQTSLRKTYVESCKLRQLVDFLL